MDIPSLFMIPSAVSSGKVYSVFPNSTDADFDFTRDSDATRVNSEGLIERVGYYGSELVTNGGFDSASGWNLNTNWTINNGVASCDGTNSNDINQNQNVGVIGKSYRISFTIVSISQGGIAARIGSGVTNYYTEAGTYTEIVTATSTDRIRVSVQGNAIASIDNLSIKEVTGDRARLNYEIEGGLVNTKPSLLLEPQSTNLVTYSEDFSNAYWTKSSASITSDSTTSPDGTLNADKLVEDTSTGVHQLSKTMTTISATDYAYSIFVKAGERSFLRLSRAGGSTAVAFDLINKTVTNGGSGTGIITELTNGWFKCSFMFPTVGTSTDIRVELQIVLSASSSPYTGDGVSGVYIWGAMLEQLSYATSYIPTNGSTQTRAAETCNGAGTSSILPSEEGILYIETSYLTQTSPTIKEISINDGTTANRVALRLNTTTNQIRAIVRVGSSNQFTVQETISNVTNFNKIAVKYKVNDFALWVNGVELITDTSGTVPSGLNQIDFDSGLGADVFYGKCRDIRVYNTKEMTDSEVDILLNKITS